MLAKTLVVFYVWSPDIFVFIFIITHFQVLFILLCQIKHYHTIPYHYQRLLLITHDSKSTILTFTGSK